MVAPLEVMNGWKFQKTLEANAFQPEGVPNLHSRAEKTEGMRSFAKHQINEDLYEHITNLQCTLYAFRNLKHTWTEFMFFDLAGLIFK